MSDTPPPPQDAPPPPQKGGDRRTRLFILAFVGIALLLSALTITGSLEVWREQDEDRAAEEATSP